MKADDNEEEETEEDAEEHELDPTTAAAVVRDLKRAGFKLRQTYSKASYKQSNVESSVKSVKKILKASFLPGMAGMTVTSFTRVIQLAISTVNLRPVILLPYDSANPGELTVVSPQALRGPDHAQYGSLAKARHYTGQAACGPATTFFCQEMENFLYGKTEKNTFHGSRRNRRRILQRRGCLFNLSLIHISEPTRPY